MTTPQWTVRRLRSLDESQVGELADILVECVDDGASVSFMRPLAREGAVAFWRHVADGVAAGHRALLVAEDAEGICGTVQLAFAEQENQPHRAELVKMLVRLRARRLGVGSGLMKSAEALAVECGKTLLILDTVTGSVADAMYEGLGWVKVGNIPKYALLPDGGLCSTTVFYRDLAPS